MGNAIVGAYLDAPETSDGSSGGQPKQAPVDPDTGKFSPVEEFDLGKHLEGVSTARAPAAQQGAKNLTVTVQPSDQRTGSIAEFSSFDFSVDLSITDSEIAGFFQEQRNAEFLTHRALEEYRLDVLMK